MKDLYVLVKIDRQGSFVEYIRKGRSNAIYSYDNITGARRGLAHTRRSLPDYEKDSVVIWRAGYFKEVE